MWEAGGWMKTRRKGWRGEGNCRGELGSRRSYVCALAVKAPARRGAPRSQLSFSAVGATCTRRPFLGDRPLRPPVCSRLRYIHLSARYLAITPLLRPASFLRKVLHTPPIFRSAALLDSLGFSSQVVDGPGDGGVDIRAIDSSERLGLVQCKCKSKRYKVRSHSHIERRAFTLHPFKGAKRRSGGIRSCAATRSSHGRGLPPFPNSRYHRLPISIRPQPTSISHRRPIQSPSPRNLPRLAFLHSE